MNSPTTVRGRARVNRSAQPTTVLGWCGKIPASSTRESTIDKATYSETNVRKRSMRTLTFRLSGASEWIALKVFEEPRPLQPAVRCLHFCQKVFEILRSFFCNAAKAVTEYFSLIAIATVRRFLHQFAGIGRFRGLDLLCLRFRMLNIALSAVRSATCPPLIAGRCERVGYLFGVKSRQLGQGAFGSAYTAFRHFHISPSTLSHPPSP